MEFLAQTEDVSRVFWINFVDFHSVIMHVCHEKTKSKN